MTPAEWERARIEVMRNPADQWEDLLYKCASRGTYRKYYWFRITKLMNGTWGFHVRDYFKFGYATRTACLNSARVRLNVCVNNDEMGEPNPHMNDNRTVTKDGVLTQFMHIPHNDLRILCLQPAWNKFLTRHFKGKRGFA